MKLVLINVPYSAIRYKTFEVPPFGLGFIARFLFNNGVPYSFLDLGEKSIKGAKTFINKFIKSDVKYIGFSFYQENIDNAMILIKFIKNKFPSVKIIVGGIFPTIAHKELLEENRDIDFVVRGDGEEAVLNILSKKYKREDIGVSFRENGKLFFSSKINRLDDLDKSSPPRYKNEVIKEYNLKSKKSQSDVNVIPIVWSRGCNYNCSFCVIQANKNVWRCRSNQSILKEIKTNFKPNMKNHIIFFDANPLQDADRFEELVIEIRKDFNLTFSCAGRVDVVVRHKKIIRNLAYMGCIEMELGIESFDDDTLKYYSKHITKKMIDESLRILKENAIGIELDFILFYPGITKKEVLNNLDGLEKRGFKEDISVDALFSYTRLYLGTKMRAEFEQKSKEKINYKYIPKMQEIVFDKEVKSKIPKILVLKKKVKSLYDNTVLAETLKNRASNNSLDEKEVWKVQELLLLNLYYKILFFETFKAIIEGKVDANKSYNKKVKEIIKIFNVLMKDIRFN